MSTSNFDLMGRSTVLVLTTSATNEWEETPCVAHDVEG